MYCTLSQVGRIDVTLFHPVRLQQVLNDPVPKLRRLQAFGNKLGWSRGLKLMSVTMIN